MHNKIIVKFWTIVLFDHVYNLIFFNNQNNLTTTKNAVKN